jgi:uncharacterized small protein (DUF1192 family)
MASMDEDERPKTAPHKVGEDLATLSEAELAERVTMLKAEIDRIEAELKAKRASREAAASIFKS